METDFQGCLYVLKPKKKKKKFNKIPHQRDSINDGSKNADWKYVSKNVGISTIKNEFGEHCQLFKQLRLNSWIPY